MTKPDSIDFSEMEELWERKPTDDLAGILSTRVCQVEVVHFTTRIQVEVFLEKPNRQILHYFEDLICSIAFSDQINILALAVYETLHTHTHTHLRPYLSGYPGWVWWRYRSDGSKEGS